MKYMKKLMAVLLMTAIFVVSGAQEESAKTKTDLVVVLDAGHGGYDTGATGNGLQEKQLTYKIAQYCKAELEKYNGVSVYMTRSNVLLSVSIGEFQKLRKLKQMCLSAYISILHHQQMQKEQKYIIQIPTTDLSVEVKDRG